MSSAPDAAAAAEMWVIEPRQHGVISRARELWAYRYLWWYFASNTIRDLYRKSVFGWAWLLFRVAGPVGLSSLIFGGVLNVPSQGVPYFLFFLCGATGGSSRRCTSRASSCRWRRLHRRCSI
jgi:hypothetical protein